MFTFSKIKKIIFIIVILVAIFFIFRGLIFKKININSPGNAVVKNINQAPTQTLAPAINGELVPIAEAGSRPIAVMVENHPDARPQSGLVNADLVYETLAEGGITRFMAVFQTQSASNIGPVRSARVYFADLANELGALYAHVGGNSDALANLKSGAYPNLANADQFFNDPYFHRIKQRPMPHNVYTSTDKLEELMVAHNYSMQANVQPWKFKDDSPQASSSASSIKIDFSLKDYAVTWRYSFQANSYLRFLAGLAHKDLDSGRQIIAKNIIVQFVKISPSKTDTPLSLDMDLQSGGKAKIFFDGQETDATWSKQANDRTRYYDLNGNEINFNRGATWVELVPLDRAVTWQ